MTKEEALEDIENIRMYFADNTWNQHHFKALDIAKECIRHCIDEEEDVCYNCYDKHCENCLYSGRIPE